MFKMALFLVTFLVPTVGFSNTMGQLTCFAKLRAPSVLMGQPISSKMSPNVQTGQIGRVQFEGSVKPGTNKLVLKISRSDRRGAKVTTVRSFPRKGQAAAAALVNGSMRADLVCRQKI